MPRVNQVEESAVTTSTTIAALSMQAKQARRELKAIRKVGGPVSRPMDWPKRIRELSNRNLIGLILKGLDQAEFFPGGRKFKVYLPGQDFRLFCHLAIHFYDDKEAVIALALE